MKDIDGSELERRVSERFQTLPKVVQDAISSADVTRHLQELASAHKLHYDQWNALEVEVKLTLMGLEPIEDLEANIKKAVAMNDTEAHTLALDIGRIVFDPIRQQLERGLSHPEAKEEQKSDLEKARTAAISSATTDTSTLEQAATTPLTEPTPKPPVVQSVIPPQEPTQRSISPTTYISGAPSHERKSFDGDPYREQV